MERFHVLAENVGTQDNKRGTSGSLTKQPGVSSLDHSKSRETESYRSVMNQRPIRVLAVVLLLSLVAVQAHICFEASAARSTRHQCQLCKSGGWAEPEQNLSLDARVASDPLQVIPSAHSAQYQPIEASSSRAPPLS